MTQDSQTRGANFIGYASVEQWANFADAFAPVYCLMPTEPGKATSHGMRVDNLVIALAQTDARGDVHYVRLPVGSLTYLLTAQGKQPWDSDHAERQARADAAYAIVRAWLNEHFTAINPRFAAREATVAMPTNLRLLDGWANFLGWDKDAKRFFRQDEVRQ